MKKLIFLVVLSTTWVYSAEPPRGSQVRLTERLMKYVAGIAIKSMQEDLKNKNLPNQNGNAGPASFTASNIKVLSINIGRQDVDAINSMGLRLSVHDININAQASINARAKIFFATLQDNTNVKFDGRGIGFTLDVNIDSSYSKPSMSVRSCNARIGDLGLQFSGGMAMLYNMFSGVLKNMLKDRFSVMICDEVKKLANSNMNDFLKMFPVQQNVDDWALLDYSFEKPLVTNNYIDLYLRGEFLDQRRPIRSKEAPPSFETNSQYDKMVYVWLSDWTLNSAGRVFHKAGLLQKLFSPQQKKEEVPDDVKPFLNTKGCEQIIPLLHKSFPNQPLQFNIETARPPTCDITPKGIEASISVVIKVDLLSPQGNMMSLFYINLDVNALVNLQIKTINQQLIVSGSMHDFKFAAQINSAVLGGISLSMNNTLINVFISAMVINQANAVLQRGFPIPNINGIDIINPRFCTVQDAIRIDTDIRLLNMDVLQQFG